MPQDQLTSLSALTPGNPAGSWSDAIGWLQLLSDLALWGACAAICAVMVRYLTHRKDAPFSRLIWLFVAMMSLLGLTHLLDALQPWTSWRLLGVMARVGAAALSWATVAALFPALSRVLAQPGRAEQDERLLREVHERHAAEQRFATIFEASPSAMLAIDVQGRIQMANALVEDIFGHRRETLLGQPLSILVPAEVRSHHHDLIKAFFKAPTARVMGAGRELHGVRADGSEVPLEIALSPLETGHELLVLAVIADITARKQAEALLRQTARDLQRSNEELEQFAYVASHDLKAPLRAIKTLSMWIEEDSRGTLPPRSYDHMNKLRGRVTRMERLLDDLLQYSRVGREPTLREVFDAEEALEVALGVTPMPEGFTVLRPRQLPAVAGSHVELELVLRNLLSNAVKHHDRSKGQIRIEWQEAGEFIRFHIEDDGPGIAPDYHGRIFQMFQTLRPRDEVEGSGVGLALIKKIVERGRGQIEVDSSGARGTRFTFTWPGAPRAEEPAP